MNLRLATELQLYLDGLVPLDALSNVAHEVLAHEVDGDAIPHPDTNTICHLIADYNKGAITEAWLKIQLPAVPEIEVVRDTMPHHQIPTPPPSFPTDNEP